MQAPSSILTRILINKSLPVGINDWHVNAIKYLLKEGYGIENTELFIVKKNNEYGVVVRVYNESGNIIFFNPKNKKPLEFIVKSFSLSSIDFERKDHELPKIKEQD